MLIILYISRIYINRTSYFIHQSYLIHQNESMATNIVEFVGTGLPNCRNKLAVKKAIEEYARDHGPVDYSLISSYRWEEGENALISGMRTPNDKLIVESLLELRANPMIECREGDTFLSVVVGTMFMTRDASSSNLVAILREHVKEPFPSAEEACIAIIRKIDKRKGSDVNPLTLTLTAQLLSSIQVSHDELLHLYEEFASKRIGDLIKDYLPSC